MRDSRSIEFHLTSAITIQENAYCKVLPAWLLQSFSHFFFLMEARATPTEILVLGSGYPQVGPQTIFPVLQAISSAAGETAWYNCSICLTVWEMPLLGVTGYLVPKQLNRTESQSTANVQTYSDKVATLLPFLDSNRIEASLARWSNSLGKPKPGCLANRRVDFHQRQDAVMSNMCKQADCYRMQKWTTRTVVCFGMY